MQLANLCDAVSNLVGSVGDGADGQSPTYACSPSSTIRAVSKLVQEHSETNNRLTIVRQRLEVVYNTIQYSTLGSKSYMRGCDNYCSWK